MADVNEITNLESEESPKTPQVKDPKKVKAGKALARKNAEGRKLVKQDDASLRSEEISSQGTPIDIPTIYNGIKSIAGIVGTGFTLYHGWKFYESYSKSTPKVEPPKVEPKNLSENL